ncbi:MAG: hypothetical protein NDF55_08475 [archaeon GB-1867-005]|nr:hypothetical protein [Candidatus Culexmicrobium cathedralense]
MNIKYKYLPFIASLIASTTGIIFAFIVESPILLLFLIELASTSAFYLLFLVILSSLQPEKVDMETTFACGLAKPPYLDPNELYQFKFPIVEEEGENE